MSRRLARSVFLFLMLSGTLLFGQNKSVEVKLKELKSANDLANWIYERLDYVDADPTNRLNFLIRTQKEIWRDSKTPAEHYAWLNLLNTQGYYQLRSGNILGSIQQYEAAFNFYNKYKVTSYDIVEYTLKPLSNNYTRLGDYERALYLQKISIKYQQKLNKSPNEIASIFCNLAISYRSMANLDSARKAIDDGLALRPNATIQIMLNNVLADVLYDQQKYVEALKLVKQNIAQPLQTNSETAYWLMGAHTTAGNIYSAQGTLSAAKSSYEKALLLLEVYYPHGRIREKANLFTQLGKLALVQKNPAKAVLHFNETLATLGIANHQQKIILENIYGDNKLVEVFVELANAQLKLNNPKAALENIRLSLLAADKIRHEFANDKTKERLQVYLKQIVEKGIKISYELFQQTKNKTYLHQIAVFTEQSKGRTLLDQMERNNSTVSNTQKNDSLFIKKKALERNITYQEKQNIENKQLKGNQSIEGLRFQLALINKAIANKYKQLEFKEYDNVVNFSALPKHRFITYFFGEENIYIVNIYNQKIENVVQLKNAAAIKQTIKTFVGTYFQNGANAMLNNPKSFYASSHLVYQTIFAPLKIKPNEMLTIIPDGILGYLSFDGLITKPNYIAQIAKWPFFIKDYHTNYAFSLKTLQLKQPKDKADTFTGLFITHEGGNKAPLKAVEAEANWIGRSVRGNFLFNEEVNAGSFEKEFNRSTVLHIGTHAYLSGKNQEPTLDFGKEKFFLFELSAKQTAPSLVILSACRTGDGFLADGEGIISLSRGFKAVGTTATIASLWNVNDHTVAAISGTFYKLLGERNSSSTSLRLAKLAWLNNPTATNATLLPYYWDSLVYMGQDQSFKIQKPWSFKPWLLGGLTLLALLALTSVIVKLRKRQ